MARVQTNTSKTNESNNKSGKTPQKNTVSKKWGTYLVKIQFMEYHRGGGGMNTRHIT